MSSDDGLYVCVLYDFSYLTDDGRTIFMKEGEEFFLLDKTNEDWWQVIRDVESSPFYAPANYLEIISFTDQEHSIGNDSDINANVSITSTSSTCKNAKKTSISVSKDEITSRSELFGLMFNNPLCIDDETLNGFSKNALFQGHEINDPDSISVDNDNSDSVWDEKCRSSLEEEYKENSMGKEPTFPIYVNIPLCTTSSPPTPDPKVSPLRVLLNNWTEYVDDNGRKYYYNLISKEVTWKPPRHHRSSKVNSEKHKDSSLHSDEITAGCFPKLPQQKLKAQLNLLTCDKSASSICSSSESLDSSNTPVTPSEITTVQLPPNWIQECDVETGEMYFFNIISKTRWFCSLDDNGQIYFYEENGAESLWELPHISITDYSEKKEKPSEEQCETEHSILHEGSVTPSDSVADNPALLSSTISKKQKSPPPMLPDHRQANAHSLIVTNTKIQVSDEDRQNLLHGAENSWPNFSDKKFVITRQGTLNKTKMMESGRQVRKKWSSSFVVLTDLFLVFYKDIHSSYMNAPGNKPEMCINLTGAIIEWGPDKSSKKNVFQISSVYGHQLLLQDDNAQTTKEWFDSIRTAISKLPSGFDLNHGHKENLSQKELQKEDGKKVNKLARSRSAKQCHDSSEDLVFGSPSERKKRIRDKLRYFFLRRPTLESLREKGIFKDEPVFGCHLLTLCSHEKVKIPKFVRMCVAAIEEKEMTADGLYRASGNLSQIQKIRFQVNQDDYSGLKTEEDVHVLTGALKMFFRDMREPLFPFKSFDNFLAAIALPDRHSRLKTFQELVNSLPVANYETLRFLLKHLLRVTAYSSQNRMHVQNLAIVFGPTLMWPKNESSNIALDMMHQNRIMEFFLLEYESIFN